MARRFRARATFVRSPGQKVWVGAGVTATTIVGSSATLFSTLNAAALLLRPFTILRSRILISIRSDQVATSEFAAGVYAKQVVTESAAAAGVASVPTGISESNADFYVYQPLFHWFSIFTAVATNAPGDSQYMIDSKAMRKVKADDDIATTIELRTTPGAIVATEGRTLVLLH